jgi:hypothetical protein
MVLDNFLLVVSFPLAISPLFLFCPCIPDLYIVCVDGPSELVSFEETCLREYTLFDVIGDMEFLPGLFVTDTVQ